jgi:hypothetical protein
MRDSTLAGYGIVDEVAKRRRPCEGFFPYKPGYSPSEHRALQEKKQEPLWYPLALKFEGAFQNVRRNVTMFRSDDLEPPRGASRTR